MKYDKENTVLYDTNKNNYTSFWTILGEKQIISYNRFQTKFKQPSIS